MGGDARDRVIVFGGTGWLGHHVAEAFRRSGHDVLVVARTPAKVLGENRFRSMDVVGSSPEEIAELLRIEQPTVVVNAAGRYWGVTEDEMRSSLFVLAERLIAALALLDFRPRFLQLGTVMEYGVTEPGVPVTDATDAAPRSPYGRFKLAATHAVLDATRDGLIDGLVLRVVNLAGPGTPAPSLLGKVLARLGEAHVAGRSAVVELAPLNAERDYLDIRDAAEAVVAAAHGDLTGCTVPIGSGCPVPVRWLVTTLIKLSGVDTDLIEREPEGGAASTGAGGNWLSVDPLPAREHFGWVSRRSLTGALLDDWEDFRDQE